MAVRKTKNASRSAKGGRGKKTPSPTKRKSYSWAVLFWLAFVILIFGLYIFNREAISASVQAIKKEFASRSSPPDTVPETVPVAVPATPEIPVSPQPSPAASPPTPAATVPAPVPPPAAVPPAPVPPAAQTATPAATPPKPVAPPAGTSQAAPAAQTEPQNTRPAGERRERALYFTQVDRGGAILRIKVNRNLPVSSSPMTDVIQALIGGPSPEEKSRGLISLIPPNTKILSATVRDDTAYISFSEDFQYNTYGVEGYAGQLRQIVYTATEFPNVKNVQILIEGRRIDFLGEGVWIGSPLNRDML